MKKLVITAFLAAALLIPLACASFSLFSGTVPSAAKDIADQMDRQLMTRYSSLESDAPFSKKKAAARARIVIVGTTPVNVNDLSSSCPLSRQMTEEVSSRLMALGYRWRELRKGSCVRFNRDGEFVLTREVKALAEKSGNGTAILVGTYVISGNHVRFSVSLVTAGGNEAIAKASASVPITDDLLPLLDEGPSGTRVPPPTTRLQ